MTYVVIDTHMKRPEAGVDPADLPVDGRQRGDELSTAFVAANPELVDKLAAAGLIAEVERVAPLYDTFRLFV